MGVSTYYESWHGDWVTKGEDMQLAKLNGFQVVYLAFCRPDPTYVIGSLEGTGLEFNCGDTAQMIFRNLQVAISTLRLKGTKVMLSVGGGSYAFPSVTYPHVQTVTRLARDLGCDGIDLDVENTNVDVGVLIDEYRKQCILQNLTFLSAAVWSTGAFPKSLSSPYQGMNLGLLEYGHLIDWINLMAYDAGDDYNRASAFAAYRAIFKGPIVMGIELGPQAWGGHVSDPDEIKQVLHDYDQVFLWSYQKDWKGSLSPEAIVLLATLQTPLLGSATITINPTPPTAQQEQKKKKMECPVCNTNFEQV